MKESIVSEQLNPTDNPTVKSAIQLYFISMVLIVFLGGTLQYFWFWPGLTFTEIFLILLPTVLFLRKNNLSIRKVLHMEKVEIFPLFLSVVLGLCVWPLGVWLNIQVVNFFKPGSLSVEKVLDDVGAMNQFYKFLVMGVCVGLCEEILFRGYLQTAFISKFGVLKGVALTAVMFSCFHLVPATVIATLPLSFLLCWICWRFESVYPAMLLHLTNNFLAPFIMIKSGYPAKFLISPATLGVGFIFILGVLLVTKKT